MKLNKIFMLGLMATAALFTACSSDHDYEWGKQAGSNNVTFANEENLVLALSENSFDVTLSRTAETSASAISVPIEVLTAPDFMTIPSTVEFAAGQTEATMTIAIGEGMETFVDYNVSLRIAEDYTNSYVNQDNVPLLNITVLKEDYAPYGVMKYTSWFFEDSWDVEVEYSTLQDLYRAEIFTDGYPFYFAIDDEGLLRITDKNGKDQQDTATGYYEEYNDYGWVTLRWLSANYTGIRNGVFYLPAQYRVSAGSFGSKYDTFTLTAYLLQ